MSRARLLPPLLATATVCCQVAYPIVEGDARTDVTVAVVCVFAAFSLTHAAVHFGPSRAVGLLAVAGGIGFGADVIGVATGFPFGDYTYTDRLGPRFADVPVLIALAWTMMAYPALLAARRLVRGTAATVGVAAVALASWDLFLDPMMVAERHWRWSDVTWSSPGAPDVPVSNYLGWLLVALVLMTVLHAALPRRQTSSPSPLLIYLWVYVSSVLASAVFFDRPGVALVGGIAMGAVAVPLGLSLWRR